MPDNIDVTPGSGASVSTDLVGGAHYQVIKVALGADGAVDAHLDSGQQLMAASVPVVLASDHTDVKVTLDSEAVAISGSVAVTNAGLTSLAGTVDGTELRVAIISGAGSGGTAAADDADFTAGTTQGTPAMGVYESAPTSVTDGDLGTVGITQTRALRTAIEGTVTVGSHAVTNAGVFAVQAAQSGTWNVGTVTAVTAISNALPSGTNNIGDVDVLTLPALPAGTNAIGKLAANSGVDIGDVDVTSISAGTNLIGDVGLQPRATGGMTISRDIDLDNGTLTVVKGSAGAVYGWTITNTTTATVYVKFYDAASGTLGTGTPVLTIGIPGNATDDTTLAQSFGGLGIAFATGICVGAGTGVADNDNTDPGANGVIANIYYK